MSKEQIKLVKNPEKLELAKKTSFYIMFTKFDEAGKIQYIGEIFSFYFDPENKEKYFSGDFKYDDEREKFCKFLYEALGYTNIHAILTTLEGNATYSRNMGCSVEDIIKETEMIINNEEYRKKVETDLTKSPWLYEEWLEMYAERGIE